MNIPYIRPKKADVIIDLKWLAQELLSLAQNGTVDEEWAQNAFQRLAEVTDRVGGYRALEDVFNGEVKRI